MLYIILMFIFSDVDDAFLGSYLQSCDILYCIESLSHRFVFVNASCESQFFHVFGRELHLHVVPMGDNFHQILQRAAVEQEVARVPRGVKINIHLLDVWCSACFQGCHIAWFQQVFFTVLAAHTNFTFHQNNAGYTFFLHRVDIKLGTIVVYISVGSLYYKRSFLRVVGHDEIGFSLELYLRSLPTK